MKKNFEKKFSGWLPRDLKSEVVKPPINLITIVKMSSYISLCPIFEKLGMLVHFIVNSDLEKILVDSGIFARVMALSILKCGSKPPMYLTPH